MPLSTHHVMMCGVRCCSNAIQCLLSACISASLSCYMSVCLSMCSACQYISFCLLVCLRKCLSPCFFCLYMLCLLTLHSLFSLGLNLWLSVSFFSLIYS